MQSGEACMFLQMFPQTGLFSAFLCATMTTDKTQRPE